MAYPNAPAGQLKVPFFIWICVVPAGLFAGQARSRIGTARLSGAVVYLWKITQPFGLRCRAENKARKRAAHPVGAASAAKQAPRWMAPASPVFAAEAAPTGSLPNQCVSVCSVGAGLPRERAGTGKSDFQPPQKSPSLPGPLLPRRLPTPARYARSAWPATGKRGSPARHGRPRTRVRCGTSRCWLPRSRSPAG